MLDNHDDFGGHAKRNEFELNGQLNLMQGGTLLIDSPRPYSAVADGVLKAIGIDAPALAKVIAPQDPDFYDFMSASRTGLFFDRRLSARTTLRSVIATSRGANSWPERRCRRPPSGTWNV